MAGASSQRSGQSFENIFESMCAYVGAQCTQMPQGCRQAGRRLIRVKTPFDWIVTNKGVTALIDTKANNAASFPHSLIVFHQLKALIAHHRHGAPAGYVVGLRDVDTTLFIPADVLDNAYGVRGSISPQSPGCTILGTYSRFDIRKILRGTSPPV